MSTLRVLDKDGNWIDIPTIVGPVGPVGPTGETGPGVSSGGSTGQILRKKSEDDFDTEWITPTDMDLYYTKEEADDLINSKISTTFKYKGTKSSYAAIQAVTNPVVGDVWNDASTDHNYVWNGSTWDKLAGTVDMSNYYTMDEAEDMVDNKLAAVPINDLLHYKGHVDTVEDLPSTGQTSATLEAPSLHISSTTRFTNGVTTHRDVIKNAIPTAYKYYVGGSFLYSGVDWRLKVYTNFPECIDGISFSRCSSHYLTTNAYYLLIHITYDPAKPVYANMPNGNNYLYSDSTKTYSQLFGNGKETLITESGWVCLGTPTTAGNHIPYLYSNLKELVFRENDIQTFKFWSSDDEPVTNSYKTVRDETGFVYKDGYRLVKFVNEIAQWVGAEAHQDAKLNSLFSVGNLRELYRCSESSAWEKLSDFKEFQVAEMTEEDYSELLDKNTFDLYILDRMAEVTETTNLLLNSITGDIDLVEANISEEEALAITNEIIGGVSDE